jgi:dipeptidyl aminopeptidase/acylaminoacyl peptidase
MIRKRINRRAVQVMFLSGLAEFLGIPGHQPAALAASKLTMAQIASAPFPALISGAPKGNMAAWMYNERGARNIWVADIAADDSGTSRRLTAYMDDDGIDISALAWNGDGHSVFYVRGGDAGGRVSVNPMSLAPGVKAGSIFAVSVDGGEPKRIADGTNPEPSPRGDLLVFLRLGQPFAVPATGGEATPLWRDRGNAGSLTWSPDGSKLAFVSTRPQHSIIGVYDLAAKTISWMAPGFDKDREPVWSPDGKRIAFVRSPTDGAPRWFGDREGYPWELWLADVASGASHRLWRAKPGIGSRFRELFNSRNSLFWMRGDKLFFPWEGTGWVRLYSIPAAGGDATLLTPGEAEIFGAQKTADGDRLVFTTNMGDLDYRHVWSIDAAGSALRQLTFGKGIEDMPALTQRKQVVVLRGDARYPLRPAIAGARGMVDIAGQAIPKDFPSDELVTPELVTFKAPDGMTVHGQLFVPKDRRSKGPALIFFHGGPTNRQTFAAWDPFETHTHLYEANQFLANQGFVVLSVNYRGGSGYGFEHRLPKGFGAAGASELQDIIGAAEYMIAHPDVDPAKLGVWGGSYGGRMTALALSRAPQYFAAGADYAGIYDWTKMPGYDANDPASLKLANDSAPVGHMDAWRAPVLLMHSDADTSVPFEQTTLLLEALRKRNIPVETLMLPDEVHFLLRHASWNKIFEATADYMNQHLN